jgi:hypothetical protein
MVAGVHSPDRQLVTDHSPGPARADLDRPGRAYTVAMTRTAVVAPPARGALRTVRAAVFAGSAVWLSLIAHVAGGGSAPPIGLVLALVLLTSVATTLLAGRRRGHLSIAVTLMSLQVLLHQAFALLATD